MNLEYVGAAFILGGFVTMPVVAGVFWLVPDPYHYVAIVGWAMVMIGFHILAAAGERDDECRYCGDAVGGDES